MVPRAKVPPPPLPIQSVVIDVTFAGTVQGLVDADVRITIDGVGGLLTNPATHEFVTDVNTHVVY